MVYHLFLILALALAITGPIASAAPLPEGTPDISAVPDCALSCVLNSLPSTGCGSDFVCICRSAEYNDNLVPCVQRQCPPDKAATTFHVLCGS
jgi:hypothetical protein